MVPRSRTRGRHVNTIFADLPTSIFEEMSALARHHQAINLGQGFPDDPGPEDVRRKAAEAVVSGWNQYPPMLGIPELRQAVARHYADHQGLAIDPATEVMITSPSPDFRKSIAARIFGPIVLCGKCPCSR